MVKRTLHKGTSLLLAAAFGLSLLANPVRAQEAVERSFAIALIRDVLTAVNHGNWTGNYTVVRDYSSQSFSLSHDATALSALFLPLRSEHLDLLQVLVSDPVILKSELSAGRDEMRLLGYFPLQPEHVSFDLTFVQEGTRWRFTGISVGAFPPI